MHIHTHTFLGPHITQIYRLMECEELQGSNISAFGDGFTVATAVEDLQFGFSVVTSTQVGIKGHHGVTSQSNMTSLIHHFLVSILGAHWSDIVGIPISRTFPM